MAYNPQTSDGSMARHSEGSMNGITNKGPGAVAAATTTGVFFLAGLAHPLVAAAAASPPAEPAEPGLLDVNLASAVWVLIIFVVLVFVLYKTAWKNVLAGLNAREARIRGNIADAEAARVKGEASLVEYNKQLATAEGQVRELLAKAVADAERIATGIKMRAQQDAEAAKEAAVKDIETSKQQALTEIYDQAATLATSVAEKILRRNINADDQKALVDESLRQMQTV